MAYTLTELRSFVEPARDQFCSIIPDSDCVKEIPIHVLSDRTWIKKRTEIIRRLGSSADEDADTRYSSGELIIGKTGEEIIVREEKDKQQFLHTIWHELGHAFAKEKEGKAFWQITETKDAEVLDGYLVWKEFIAESIANTIAGKTNAYYYYGPDGSYLVLHDYLEYAFGDTDIEIPDGAVLLYYLAFYFAKLITDPGVLEAKRLATFDFSAVKDLNPTLQDPMEDIIILLKQQMSNTKFWCVDKSLLIRITELVQMLRGYRGLARFRGQDCVVRDPDEYLKEVHPGRYI